MSTFRSRSRLVRTAVLGASVLGTVILTTSGAAFAGSRPKPPPPKPLVLVAPTSVSTSALDATTMHVLTGTRSSGKSYEIFLNGAARPGNYYSSQFPIFDYDDAYLQGLTPDTTYVITVREGAFDFALNKFVRGPFSAPVTVHTLTRAQSAPSVPTGFRVVPPVPYSTPVPHQLFIQWDPSTDNIDVSSNLDYRFYLNGVSQGFVCAGSSYCFGETNIGVSNLVPGATYRLSVEAVDKGGNTSARSADFVFIGV